MPTCTALVVLVHPKTRPKPPALLSHTFCECRSTITRRLLCPSTFACGAGRFGTKGLAISFVSKECKEDVEVLNTVQSRFEVNIAPLPDEIDTNSYMAN